MFADKCDFFLPFENSRPMYRHLNRSAPCPRLAARRERGILTMEVARMVEAVRLGLLIRTRVSSAEYHVFP